MKIKYCHKDHDFDEIFLKGLITSITTINTDD